MIFHDYLTKGMLRSLQILRASLSMISACRGTAVVNPFVRKY
jgi:hypothetical protein